MGFRFYVADLFKGTIEGTNDALLAGNLSYREGYLIVDTVKGERLMAAGDRMEVTEIEKTLNRRIDYIQFRNSLRTAHIKLNERKASRRIEQVEDAATCLSGRPCPQGVD